jgi:hypothetical protein
LWAVLNRGANRIAMSADAATQLCALRAGRGGNRTLDNAVTSRTAAALRGRESRTRTGGSSVRSNRGNRASDMHQPPRLVELFHHLPTAQS